MNAIGTAGTGVGEGLKNTAAMIAQRPTVDSAGTSANFYGGKGRRDWFLPSKGELNELCKYARSQTTGNSSIACASAGTLRAGFSADSYWSSSENRSPVASGLQSFDFVWIQSFNNGFVGIDRKLTPTLTRPIRGF